MAAVATEPFEPLSEEVLGYLKTLPSLTGREAIVTGANGALGLTLTRLLAHKGARVTMACRNVESGAEGRRRVLTEVPDAELSVVELDLGSLDSVKEFARGTRESLRRLDLLFCHAGIMAVKRRLTEEGFESQFGVNHLGHFALVGQLLPLILETPEPRVVSTTSSAAFSGRIAFSDLMGERRYNRWLAYAQSKLANVMFSNALQRRFAAAGARASAHSAHPGLVHTNLQRRAAQAARSAVERWLLNGLVPTLGQGPEMGAVPLLFAGVSPQAQGGDLWGPRWRYTKGRPVVQSQPRAALDRERQERLWRVSEELTGVRYEVRYEVLGRS